MLKKLTEGLMFGAGFAISFTIIWYIGAYLIFPAFIGEKLEKEANQRLSDLQSEVGPPQMRSGEWAPGPPFHEQGPEEKIKEASAIALAKYEPGQDGKMKAVITEFLKKSPDAKIHYDISDEYGPGSYYPEENVSRGEALLIFFTGSRPWATNSMAVYRGRITGLGDMPLELFRNKAREAKE